ncbi:MAG: DUF4832 domain-containing protein, partial [Sulfitobacter sp.]|nr:DUF4832 domain-containing protein [Sulfitobacter sp.]
DHFVADPASPGAITATDYGNRGDMLSALLTALPASRMAQLRTPHYKHQIYSVYTGTPPLPIPLTQFEAHGGTDIARTGHHNDCFLASADDFGTYNAGWASIAEDKTYLGEETRFVPMGGETCNPNPPRSECASALTELALLHWSYLNIDYHPDVIGSWVTGSCFGEIENRLGYRFTLVRATYDDAVETGAALNVRIELRNDGWAAPFNPRPVNLVLRHNYSGSVYSFPLANADPRFWEAGDVQILDYDIPVYLPSGKYTLLLHLPDPESSIATRPEYALRLANNSAWEAGTGYNVLGHTLDVFDPTLDTDGDGTLDIDDDDDDDDLLTDTFEENNSLDPLDPDTDGDMIMDGLDDAPGVFSNLCNTLGSNDAVFENVTVSSGTSVTCAAVNSVQIEPTLSIESGGTARVVSPSIRFANTFQIPTGGEITIDSRSPMP